jgi:hypothetical protein
MDVGSPDMNMESPDLNVGSPDMNVGSPDVTGTMDVKHNAPLVLRCPSSHS